MFPLLVSVINVLILPRCLPTIQEIIHRIKPVGIRISVTNFDVNYGVSMMFP